MDIEFTSIQKTFGFVYSLSIRVNGAYVGNVKLDVDTLNLVELRLTAQDQVNGQFENTNILSSVINLINDKDNINYLISQLTKRQKEWSNDGAILYVEEIPLPDY